MNEVFIVEVEKIIKASLLSFFKGKKMVFGTMVHFIQQAMFI